MKTKLHSSFNIHRSTFSLLAVFTLLTAAARAPAQTGWGNALSFDGINDAVSASGITLTNTSMTIELWAQRTTFSQWNPLVCQGWGALSNGLYFSFAGSAVAFGYYGGELFTAQSFSDTNWHHWAATHNLATGERSIYRDGLVVATDTNWWTFTGSGDLWIAKMPWSAPDYFGGQIDEVRIWNVAHTTAEIRQHFNRRLTGGEPNLIGYWKFDEGGGDTAHDSTANGRHGALINGPQWTPSAIPWLNALSFDGVNDYVSAAIPQLASNYTVSAWVFLRAGGNYWGNRVGLLSATTCNGSAEVLIHNLSDSSAPQYLWLGRCGAFDGVNSTLTVASNQWTHLAVTVSSNKQVSYFINGSLAGSWNGSALNLTLGPNITLGDNTVRRFNGILDDFRIWNVARSQAEIQADLCHPSTGSESNLAAYWNFDEGAGTTAYDSTTNSHNGTLVNGPVWTNSTIPPFININAGLPGVYNSSVAWGDYDNDGRPDILLTGNSVSGFIAQVWRNTGSGFTNINAGLPGVGYSSVRLGRL